MSNRARLTSFQALVDMKAGMETFRDDVSDALVAVETECRRILDWLKHDQLQHWQRQIRVREEKVNEAKGDLHRKKITASFGEHSSLVDEKVILKKAQMRLEEATEKCQLVRKWAMAAEQAINEYHAQAQSLTSAIDFDVPKAVRFLEQSLRSLESYVTLAAPSGSSAAMTGSSSDYESVGSAASGSPSGEAAAFEATGTDEAHGEAATDASDNQAANKSQANDTTAGEESTEDEPTGPRGDAKTYEEVADEPAPQPKTDHA